MVNKIQPRPQDSASEETIEKNLKEMNYPSSEDVMRGGREAGSAIETSEEYVPAATRDEDEKAAEKNY